MSRLFGSSKPRIVTTTQQQSTTPWAEQVSYLKQAFGEAKKLFEADNQKYFPKPTIVPFSPETENALRRKAQRAIDGSAVNKLAQSQILSVLKGDFLNSNPTNNLFTPTAQGSYLTQTPVQAVYKALIKENSNITNHVLYPHLKQQVDTNEITLSEPTKKLVETEYKRIEVELKNTILKQIDHEFHKQGRTNSFAHQKVKEKALKTITDSIAENISKLVYQDVLSQRQQKQQAASLLQTAYTQQQTQNMQATQMMAQDFARERGLQLNASAQLSSHYNQALSNQLQFAKLAPLFAQQDYYDLHQLAHAGSMREAMAQTQLNDEVERWNFNENHKANKIAQYLGLIGGGYGGESLASTTQPLYKNHSEQEGYLESMLTKSLFDLVAD